MQVPRTIYPFTKQHIDFLLPALFLSPTLRTFQQRDVVSVLQSIQCTTPVSDLDAERSQCQGTMGMTTVLYYLDAERLDTYEYVDIA